MAGTEWHHFPALYGRLGPPLSPAASDVATFREAIRGHDRRVLLLGVTPKLAGLGEQLVAVDGSPEMVASIWPGDCEGRRATLGAWSELPFEDGAFDAVIGDGSLNSAPHHVEQVLAEARRVLPTGGRAAFRLFVSPDTPETLDAIQRDVMGGWPGNAHALKWRVAMALAASRRDAIVPAREILAAFDGLFPDRDDLAARTGWSKAEIDTLDAYIGADHSLGFPTLSAYCAMGERHFARSSVLPSSGYPLAERCPTMVLEA
jgi:SAM-dependent methyltransferase